MKLSFSCLLIFLATFQTGFSQSRTELKIDSLLLADSRFRTEDKAMLERYKMLYKCYDKINRAEGVEKYVNKTIKLAEQLKLLNYIGEAYYDLGFYYHSHGNYIQAEEAYDKGIKKSIEYKDRELYANIHYNLGAMYASWSDYNKALNANLEAVAAFNELGDKVSVAGCFENIATCYGKIKQYKTAIGYLEQAARVFKQEKGNEYGLALCYADLGSNYYLAEEKDLGISKTKKYQLALNYLDLGLALANQIQDPSLLGDIFNTRARIFAINGSREQALEAFRKGLEFNRQSYDQVSYAANLLSLADFYIDNSQYHDAEPLLVEALNIGRDNKLPAVQRDVYLTMSKVAEKQEQYIAALDNYKAYINFRDQLFNEEKEREITRKRLQLDFLIKENDYKEQQHLMSLDLQKRTLEANERKQELELKEKESRIEKLAFLQKQASLESEKLQKESELERQRLNASLDRKVRDERILRQENKTKLNRNLSIFLGVLVLGLSGAALLVYRAHRKTEKLNRVVLSQKAELEELGKVKDRILGMVSHDMRAPVNSLISFTRLLEHGNLSEEKLKAYTLSLSHTLGHTSSMMENLLNWAYSQMQGFKPDLKVLQLSHLVKELVTATEADAARKNIRISFSQDKEANVYGDTNMLSLILRNLLSNAIKFTPEGGCIDVNLLHDSRQVRLSVADTGVGMSEAQLQWINSGNSIQLGRSTAGTNSEKGTGLGLTLCKTFATMMYAGLSVSSDGKKGTVFVLAIPIKTLPQRANV